MLVIHCYYCNYHHRHRYRNYHHKYNFCCILIIIHPFNPHYVKELTFYTNHPLLVIVNTLNTTYLNNLLSRKIYFAFFLWEVCVLSVRVISYRNEVVKSFDNSSRGRTMVLVFGVFCLLQTPTRRPCPEGLVRTPLQHRRDIHLIFNCVHIKQLNNYGLILVCVLLFFVVTNIIISRIKFSIHICI